MLAEQNVYIEGAYKKDKEKCMEHEAREKAVRDYNQSIFEATDNFNSDTISKITGLSLKEIEKIVILQSRIESVIV